MQWFAEKHTSEPSFVDSYEAKTICLLLMQATCLTASSFTQNARMYSSHKVQYLQQQLWRLQ